MRLDQLVFGYEHGHRQMAASCELDRASASLLLGLTDASIEDSSQRLVTGVPLVAARVYALAATWAAPELGRVGAVWAHVLLIGIDDLGEAESISALRDALRRPSLEDLDQFQTPIALSHVRGEPLRADSRLLAYIFAAARAENGAHVVVHDDLAAAEVALLRLWELQWPALRATFSFRTRDTIRPSAESDFVTVTRRLRGISRIGPPDAMPSEHTVSELLSTDRLSNFLQTFGPEQLPTLEAMSVLVDIHALVDSGRPEVVAREVERHYPSGQAAPDLKTGLFAGGQLKWWNPDELTLVRAVLSATRNAWNPDRLRLSGRLERLVDCGAAGELAAARRLNGPKPLRQCLLAALMASARAADVAAVEEADGTLAIELLREREDLVADPVTWEAMTNPQVLRLLSALETPSAGILAALRTGHAQALLNTLPLNVIRDAAAANGALAADFDSAAALAATDPRLAIVLAAAGWPDVDDAALRALEAYRAPVTELWLQAAAGMLNRTSPKRLPVVLQTVFGPLHHAITDDRLSPEAWDQLDPVLPPAPDPAQRLRRLLLASVREQEWSSAALERAMRDAGPYVTELRHELDEDDPLRSLVKTVVKALRHITE